MKNYKKNYTIIAGGTLENIAWHKENINNDDMIICTDSGADHARALGITPNIIIGDFDSITKDTQAFFEANKTVKSIHDPDQYSTDLEKALNWITLDAKLGEHAHPEITIYAALGGRFDHQMANILVLERYPLPDRIVIKDEHHEIRLLTQDFKFKGNIGDIVGIIPLRETQNLRYKGLKFNAPELGPPYTLGWLGTSNEMTAETGEIYMDGGLVLFVRYGKL